LGAKIRNRHSFFFRKAIGPRSKLAAFNPFKKITHPATAAQGQPRPKKFTSKRLLHSGGKNRVPEATHSKGKFSAGHLPPSPPLTPPPGTPDAPRIKSRQNFDALPRDTGNMPSRAHPGKRKPSLVVPIRGVAEGCDQKKFGGCCPAYPPKKRQRP